MSLLTGLIACFVVGVSDGDTVRVRCGDAPPARIRLAEIDAPESHQAYGNKSRQALANLIFNKNVHLDVLETDRYGRHVAQIFIDGYHVNAIMVRDGLAWCYTPYVRGTWCKPLENEARRAKRNLWADPSPVKPWEFRRK